MRTFIMEVLFSVVLHPLQRFNRLIKDKFAEITKLVKKFP